MFGVQPQHASSKNMGHFTETFRASHLVGVAPVTCVRVRHTGYVPERPGKRRSQLSGITLSYGTGCMMSRVALQS